MLQRPASGDEVCGVWNRGQLLEMDERFCRAMEAAFVSGGESRTAASATVQVRPRVTAEAVEAAIEAAWVWLWEKAGNVSSAEVMEFARARCPGVTVARVRAGFDLRWKEAPWLRA